MQASPLSTPSAPIEASGAVSVKMEPETGDMDFSVESPAFVNELDDDSGEAINASGKRSNSMSLPLPPGTLPPRKRAKTEDEKEQRRIERIMRNRQAAHASREKKRKHVEDLEERCSQLNTHSQELEAKLQQAQRSQVQTLEQQYALQNKLEQLEAAIHMAKTSGDLSVLDNLPAASTVAASRRASAASLSLGSSVSAPGATTGDSPVADECASPDDLQLILGGAPSLSHSASNSPASAEDDVDIDAFELAIPSHPFSHQLDPVDDSTLFNSSSKAHHPAEMVSYSPLESF